MRQDGQRAMARLSRWALAAACVGLVGCAVGGGAGGAADAALDQGVDAAVDMRIDPPGFVAFEGGPFTMDSLVDEPTRESDGPRAVTIAHAFWLKTTEVTRGEWLALVGRDPGRSRCEAADCPADWVNWFDAAAFANARSAAEGVAPCYRLIGCNDRLIGDGFECTGVEAVGVTCAGYRLPTEAEWEFAAKAGGQDRRYPWGDAPATCERAVMDEGPVDGDGCGTLGPLPVCARPLGHTPQGVCDLAGNLEEWAEDGFGPYADAPTDGSAQLDPFEGRVIRGGSWRGGASQLLVTERYGAHPVNLFENLGFRLARTIR